MSEALIAADLQRAATYRFLSLLFATPSDAVRDELRELSREVPVGGAGNVDLGDVRDLEGLYHQVLGPSGRVPDVECAYDINTAGGRGPLIADVAAFYKAFAYSPVGTATADQIAAELDFLGWLSMKAAYARHDGNEEHRQLAEEARAKFVRDHLGRWAMPFLDRLMREAEGTHYEAVAALTSRALRGLEGDEAFEPPDGKRHLPLVEEEIVVDENGEEPCG